MKSRHEILGLKPGVDEAEVKAAYRKLAMEHHPDKTGGDDTRFKEISQAYQSLMAQFKAMKERSERSESAYSDFFRSGKANPKQTEPFYPSDERFVMATIHVSIDEIKRGKRIPLTYYTTVDCDTCIGNKSDCTVCNGRRTVTKVNTLTACIYQEGF